MDRNQQYKANKEAKVGETIICPVCGRAFVKKQYSQAFCDSTCKDNKAPISRKLHCIRRFSLRPQLVRLASLPGFGIYHQSLFLF